MLYAGSLVSEAQTSPVSIARTSSTPVNFESSIDTTRLAEVFVAAEHALRRTISDPGLWKSLSSLEEFEVYGTYHNHNLLSTQISA